MNIAAMMGMMGGAPAGPIDLAELVAMPPCAIDLAMGRLHPPAAITMVAGTLVCERHALELLENHSSSLDIATLAMLERRQREVDAEHLAILPNGRYAPAKRHQDMRANADGSHTCARTDKEAAELEGEL